MFRNIVTRIGEKYCIKAKISLEYKENKWYVLSISWDVYEKQSKYAPLVCERNLVCCGQCDDEIREIVPMINNPEERKQWEWVLDMWKKYHLNDLHAWTPKQEAFLKELHSDGSSYDYTKDCEALADAGILVCNWYKYWTAWLFRKIPARDLNKIINFIKLDLYFPEY